MADLLTIHDELGNLQRLANLVGRVGILLHDAQDLDRIGGPAILDLLGLIEDQANRHIDAARAALDRGA